MALTWVVFAALLLTIALTDLRTHRIPNGLNAAVLTSGLLAAAVTDRPGVAAASAGIVLGGLFSLTVALVFRWLRGFEGLGMGDVKFMAAAGAWTGWQGIGPLVFAAATTALVTIGARRMVGLTQHRKTPIAFGPYLCLAVLVVRALQAAGALN